MRCSDDSCNLPNINQQQLHDFIDNNEWQAEFIREFMTPQQIEKYF